MDQAWYPHQLETEEEPEFPEEGTPEAKHPQDSKSLLQDNEPDQHGLVAFKEHFLKCFVHLVLLHQLLHLAPE